jgi:hypothetical protein
MVGWYEVLRKKKFKSIEKAPTVEFVRLVLLGLVSIPLRGRQLFGVCRRYCLRVP